LRVVNINCNVICFVVCHCAIEHS